MFIGHHTPSYDAIWRDFHFEPLNYGRLSLTCLFLYSKILTQGFSYAPQKSLFTLLVLCESRPNRYQLALHFNVVLRFRYLSFFPISLIIIFTCAYPIRVLFLWAIFAAIIAVLCIHLLLTSGISPTACEECFSRHSDYWSFLTYPAIALSLNIGANRPLSPVRWWVLFSYISSKLHVWNELSVQI